MHFCLIDDDPRLLATLEKGLRELGHECETFQSSKEGLARMLDSTRGEPDLLLLDVMMPNLDGWDFLEQLRAAGRATAVIYVTARGNVDERGPGVPPHQREAILEPFDQGEAPRGTRVGYGLGLAPARTAARSAGGSIAVEESRGGGARFRAELPRRAREAVPGVPALLARTN